MNGVRFPGLSTRRRWCASNGLFGSAPRASAPRGANMRALRCQWGAIRAHVQPVLVPQLRGCWQVNAQCWRERRGQADCLTANTTKQRTEQLLCNLPCSYCVLFHFYSFIKGGASAGLVFLVLGGGEPLSFLLSPCRSSFLCLSLFYIMHWQTVFILFSHKKAVSEIFFFIYSYLFNFRSFRWM